MCNCSLVHTVNQYHSVIVFNEGNKQNRVFELNARLSLTTDNAVVLMDKDHFVLRGWRQGTSLCVNG